MKYKHFIFDMDGTLTESRSSMSDAMAAELDKLLAKSLDIVVISGAEDKQIKKQIPSASDVILLSQNGNSCEYWINELTKEQKDRILHHIAMVRTDYSYLFTKIDKEDLLQDRGCQISFSFVGHNADLASKKAFDPDGARRTKYLHSVPFEDKEITVNVGGTTCLDYISKEGTKGKNIERLLKLKKWKPEDCVYIGDALFKGGNDESVIGVMPNLVKVGCPDDTLKFIEEQLND